jgi:hypothetical protein
METGVSSDWPETPSRLAPVIERSPLPMVEVEGSEHVVRFVNPAFCALLGKRRDELVGQHFEKVMCNGRKCIEVLDSVYTTGEGKTHIEPDESRTVPAVWLYAMWPALNEKQQPERVVIQLTRTAEVRETVTALNEALMIGGLRQHELREAAEKSNVSLPTRRVRAERGAGATARQCRAAGTVGAGAHGSTSGVNRRTGGVRLQPRA